MGHLAEIDAEVDEAAGDALHILPLAIIPLRTPALSKARLIKNARLEGVVELFAGKSTGSGQIPPEKLDQAFEISARDRQDIAIVKSLSRLPSYDVYSLRLELRRLGIAVNEHRHLRLSQSKARELSTYMAAFTRPLIQAIYGTERSDIRDLDDLYRQFEDPNLASARRNLDALSRSLGIPITGIPAFLEDYGDVYLSLAYYQCCFDQTLPTLLDFHAALDELREAPQLKSDRSLHKVCSWIDSRLLMIAAEVTNILEMFRARTAAMWERLPNLDFARMRELITGYQAKIAAALCALTVKMSAWKQRFPKPSVGGPLSQAAFIMSDLRHGIEEMPAIALLSPGSGLAAAGYSAT